MTVSADVALTCCSFQCRCDTVTEKKTAVVRICHSTAGKFAGGEEGASRQPVPGKSGFRGESGFPSENGFRGESKFRGGSGFRGESGFRARADFGAGADFEAGADFVA